MGHDDGDEKRIQDLQEPQGHSSLFNSKYKAPYVDRLNSRIGFEYALKKKVKKKTNEVE
jgi:hypothetical protein